MFLLSSVSMMTASAVRHFGLPPTPLSLRCSRCPPGLLRQNYPRGPLRPRRGLQWNCRLRAASPFGRVEEQPLRLVPRSLPLIMVSDPAGFPGRLLLGSTPPRVPRPWLPLAAAPSAPRAPTRVPTVPTPSDRDRAEPLGVPLLGLSTPSESPSAPKADLNALGAAAELHFSESTARYSHADWERATCRVYVLRRHTIHSSRPAVGLAHRSLSAFPLTPAPPFLGDPAARWQRPRPYYRRGHCPFRP